MFVENLKNYAELLRKTGATERADELESRAQEIERSRP